MKYREIKAFVYRNRIVDVVESLKNAGFVKLTINDVVGVLSKSDLQERHYSMEVGQEVTNQVKLELVCETEAEVNKAITLIREHGRTIQTREVCVYVSEVETIRNTGPE